jgi:hypothetical protein
MVLSKVASFFFLEGVAASGNQCRGDHRHDLRPTIVPLSRSASSSSSSLCCVDAATSSQTRTRVAQQNSEKLTPSRPKSWANLSLYSCIPTEEVMGQPASFGPT